MMPMEPSLAPLRAPPLWGHFVICNLLHGKAVFEHRSCTKDILEGLLRAYSSAGELPQGLTRSSLKPEFVEAAKNVVLGSTEVKCIDRLKQVLHRGTSS